MLGVLLAMIFNNWWDLPLILEGIYKKHFENTPLIFIKTMPILVDLELSFKSLN